MDDLEIVETLPEETISPVETVPEETPGFHPYETYTETQTITIEQINAVALDLMHVDLFGSFLICGTLVGIALLWRFR